LDFLDVVFHLGNKLVDLCDDSHGVLDEWINALRVPFKIFNTFKERAIHLFDSVSEKWLLNRKECRKDTIIGVGNDLEVTSLLSVSINFLI